MTALNNSAPTPRPSAWATLTRALGWLVNPSPAVKEVGARRQAQLLASLTFVLALTTTAGTIASFRGTGGGGLILLGTALGMIVAYVLSRTAYYVWGAALVSGLLMVGGFVNVVVTDSPNPIQTFYSFIPVMLVLATALLPLWGAALLAFVTLGGILALPALFPQIEFQNILATWGVLLTLSLLQLVTGNQRNVIERERLAELANTNRELENLRRDLEQRVAARTRDLTVAAEVGQRVAHVRNLDVLLAEAVELIRARFDLYYTQIYLTEPNGRALLMRAGTGQVGRELQKRGLRMPFGVGSLNGTAAAERRAVIVSNTATAPNFRSNPLLPDTRSEMCVPLFSADRVVGVLDLQSSRPGAFSEDNLPVFETLAGQLAVTIQNTELFLEAEQAKTQIEQQTQRTARSSWREFLNAVERQEQFGYTYADAAITSLTTTPLVHPDRPVLATPVLVAGEPVGELQVEGEANATWTAEEQALLDSVSRQVAQQLENLRLLAQAEDFQRQAEKALRRLTREGWEEQVGGRTGYQYELNQAVAPLVEAEVEPMALTHALTVRGEPIGELALAGMDAAADETAELVSAVADKLTAHIENLRLFDQTQTALREAETLFAVTSHLSNATTVRDIAEAVALVGQDSGLASVVLRLYVPDAHGEPEWQELAAQWANDPEAAFLKTPLGSRLRIADFPFAQYLVQATTVTLCDDILTDPRVDAASRASLSTFGARAAAFLPLTSGNQRLGYVRLTWETPRTFTAAEGRLYEATARNASVSVSNRLLFEQTQKRADREAIINTINQKIQGATSVESALQIAAREIGHRLKARRAVATLEIGGSGNLSEVA